MLKELNNICHCAYEKSYFSNLDLSQELVKPSDTFSLFIYKYFTCQIPNKKENRSTSCFLCLIMNYPTPIHFYWLVHIVGNNQNRAQNRSTKHIPSLLPQAVGHSSRITNNWRKCTQSGLRCHQHQAQKRTFYYQ